MSESKLKLAIVQGSVRDGRNGTAVAKWMHDFATKRNDVNVEYEVVDLSEYKLPLLGQEVAETQKAEADAAIQAWSEKMASFDGYIIVTPEYNHAAGGALKNAFDYLKPEVANKAAGFVGYGSLGGARAHENLRLIFGELQIADVRTAVTFSLMTDFVDMSDFNPAAYHADNANQMLDQLIAWSEGFKTLRVS
ncbi:NADPH-dependent FMN reductase [Virgibacillus ainsalahensis]